MRKKVFMWTILLLILLFAASYYFSYRYFYKKSYNRNKVGNENIAIDKDVKDVISNPSEIVTKQTKVTVNIYDKDCDSVTREDIEPYSQIIGLNRDTLLTYIETYMKNLPEEEISKGLYSFELESFSGSQVVFNKCYDSPEPENMYYIIAYDNEIQVLLADRETLYEYTSIKLSELPVDVQRKVSEGYYIRDDKELYEFLQNYSS